MANMHYDVIVIGCGGIGSAALYHLAKRGASVLGIEQFGPAHNRGSSHGHTRVIREAYFEHADYVPLVQRAYQLWQELEALHPTPLLHNTGVIEVGPADGEIIPSITAAAQQHGLTLETVDQKQAAERFPGLHIPSSMQAIFEPSGGVLMVEDCVRAHLASAQALGAEVKFHCDVRNWKATDAGEIEVTTATERFSCKQLVLTAGAWAGQLLNGLTTNLTLQAVRKHLHWLDVEDVIYRYDESHPNRCPAFLFETASGIFYGMPAFDPRGIKVSEHSGGEPLDNPSNLNGRADPQDQQRVDAFVAEFLPGVGGQRTDHQTCMYTMSNDGHFVVDRLPGTDNVSFCAGLSGHGFKFAPVLGEILADLALEGATSLPCQFLSLDRL